MPLASCGEAMLTIASEASRSTAYCSKGLLHCQLPTANCQLPSTLLPATQSLSFHGISSLLLPRTMPASALATESTFEVILFGEHDVSFFAQVIILRIKFISKRHSANANLAVGHYRCFGRINTCELFQRKRQHAQFNLMCFCIFISFDASCLDSIEADGTIGM